MHVVTERTLRAYARENKFSTAKEELDNWFGMADKAAWKELLDVQADYPSAEAVRVRNDNYTVFNICGNKFRLIVQIDYENGRIFVKDFLTHREYSNDNWKRTLKEDQIAREKAQKLRSKPKRRSR